jgi:fibronectin-binding autotransporter adhesin
MNNHLKSQGAVIFRSKDNAHRYFYFLNGKLRSFLTDEKDVLNNLAAMFGSLNALFATPQTQFLKTALSLTLLASLSAMGVAYALPEGGQSVAGNVQFSNPNSTTLNVTTNANRSIANYRAFSIGHGETVNFYLPGSDSAILNRVVGRSASEIFGNINSNGQVYLVNPNGIIFGSSAQVNVGSLFASTLGISDQDFLAGRMVFTQDPTYAPASVVNQGIINIQQGGHAVFAGAAVANSGVINAPQGQVHLVVGDQVSMLMGDGIVADVKVDRALQAKVEGLQDAIANSGNIKADGGIVKLQAELQNNIYDRLVNNSGRIEAFSVEDHDGVVSFVGHSQDGNGLVQNNGTVDVSGSVANVHGGKILIDADNIENNGALIADAGEGGTAGHIELDANNETFLNDGSLISAKAGANGNGGYVRIWSDKNTYFNPGASILANGGSNSGDGGFVEVSAKDNIDFRGLVDIGANNGNSGTLLIDPTDFTINAGNVGALTAVNGNVLIWANRDIFVSTNAFFGNQNLSSETLTLRAGRDITVNNDISTNGGNLTLLADADMTGTVPGGTTSPPPVGPGPFGGTASDGIGTITIGSGAQVDSNGGNITMVAAGIQNNSSGVGVEANSGNLSMTVTGNGNIGGTGRYDADGNTTITAGTGNVNINTEIDELTVNSGGNVTINEAGAVDINGAVITGDFTLTADQDISVDGAVSGRNVNIRSLTEDVNVQANITGQDTVSLRAGSGFFDQLSIGNFGGVTNRLVSAKTVNLRAETVRVYGNGRVTATGTNASGPALFDDNAGTAAPPIVTGNTYTAAAGGNGVVNIDGKLNNQGIIRAEGGNGGSGITINYGSSNLDLTNVTLNAASGGAAGTGSINIINDDGAGNNGTLQNVNGTAGVAGPVNITTTGGNSILGTGVTVSGTGLNLNSAGSTTLSGNFNSLPISTISVGSASITQTGATSLNITNAVASGLNSNLTFNAQGGNVTLGPVSLNAGNLDVTAGNGGILINNNITGATNVTMTTNESAEAVAANISGAGKINASGNTVLNSKDNINVNTATTALAAKADGDVTITEDNAVNLNTIGGIANSAGGNYNLTTLNGGVTVTNNVTANNITITTNETAEATNSDIASTGGKLVATNNLVVNSKDNVNVNTRTANLAAKADGNVTVNEDDAVNLNTINGITNTAGGNYNLTTTNGAVQALANVTGANITITTNETSEATNANISGPGKFVTTGTATFNSADNATVLTQAVNLAGNVAGNFTVTEDNDLNVLATSVGNHLILNAATGKVNVQGNVNAQSAALTVSSLTVDATGANTGKITVTNGIDGGPGATPTLAITSPNGVTLRGGAAADSGSIVVTNGNANIQATNGILSLQAGNGNNSGSLLMNAVSGSPVLTLNTRGLTTNAVFSQGTYSGSLVTNSPLNLVFTGTASGEGLNLNGSSKPNGGIFTNGNNLTVTAAQYNINGPINVGAADVNLLFNNSGRVFLGDANSRITNPNSNDVVLNNFELNNISANNLLIGNGATNKQYLFDVMNTTGKNVTLQTTGAFTDNTGGFLGLFPDTAAKTNITLASGKNLTLIGGNNNIGGSGNADIDILLTGGGTLKVTTTGGSVFVDTPGSFLIDSIAAASGNVSIGAVGSVNDLGTLGSTITGNNLVMDAGSIGTSGNFLNIDMNGNLDITTSGGNAYLNEASNSLINNVNTNNGNLFLTSSGTIRDMGGLFSNINTGNGSVNLISSGAIGSAGNNLSITSAGVVNAQSNGGNVFITELGDLTVGEINTNGGSASLTSSVGGIGDTGAAGSGLYTNGGDVTLQGGFLGGNLGSDAANPFDLYNVGLINADSNGGNISLREEGNMVVNDIDSRGFFGNGAIRLESTGSINDNGSAIAINSGGTGALTLISNGNIGDSSPLDIQVGDITATTKGGNINLNETGPMTIQSINTTTTMMVGKEPPVTITVGGDVTLTSSSTINDTGALVAIETGNDGSLTMTSNGAIGGTSPLNVNVGDITVTTTGGNNITIDEANNMTINSIRTGGAGNVVLTAQTGIQEADAVEDNNANIITTGQITASTVNGGIGTLTNHLDISASALNANATGTGGNVFVDQYRNPALPEGSDASMNLVGSNNATGTFQVYVVDNGALNVNGNVRATNIFMDTNNGNINVNADTEGTTSNALHARGSGSIVSGGRISGTNVQLISDNGSIVANTNATNFNAFAAGNIFIAEANSVNLGTSSAGGSFTMFTSTLFPGIYDPNSPGTILSTGEVSGAGVNLIAAGSILDGNGGANNVRSTGNAFLQAGGIIGNQADPFDVDIDGGLTVAIFGQESGFSGVLAGRARGNTLRVANRTPGLVIFNGRLVAGTAFEVALRTGLPALYTDLKNNLDPGFLNNREVAAKIVTDGTGSTIAEIINNIIAPQPFDLRLIEEDDSNTDGVDFRLIENTSSNPPEPSEDQNAPVPSGCGEGNTESPECQLQLQHLSSAGANQN